MRRVLKQFFIPHADNNFHPHILHTKRAVFYSLVLGISKLMVVVFVLLVPEQVLVSPDVLSGEARKIIALTNELRSQNSVPALTPYEQLHLSAEAKAVDMATRHYFDHLGPDGRDLRFFLKAVQYPYEVAGENLAVGFVLARDLVEAWKQSPTHYANLVDPDFVEVGVGLQVGEYGRGKGVYVAEHFGRRQVAEAQVLGIKEMGVDTTEPVQYSRESSRIFWQREKAGTRVWVEALITGDFIKAEATVHGHSFVLFPTEAGYYQSTIYLPESPEEIFAVTVAPSMTIYTKSGEVLRDFVDWERTLVVPPTLFQRYESVKDKLSFFTPLFVVSQTVYVVFFIFFLIALFLNIFIEIKKQHPHVIVQTLLLLGLAGVLSMV